MSKYAPLAARWVEMIQVTVLEGTGEEPDPYRHVVYYFHRDGRLAARSDLWEEEKDAVDDKRQGDG